MSDNACLSHIPKAFDLLPFDLLPFDLLQKCCLEGVNRYAAAPRSDSCRKSTEPLPYN